MHPKVEIPAIFLPLWQKSARYKGAWGGRGSGKSHDRAAHCVVEMLNGERVVGVREVQKSIRNSVKQLVEDKIVALGVEDAFEPIRDEIRCRSGGNMIFHGLQDHTAESIKSLENYTRCWVEEAQTISERSLKLLTPTIRAPGSEIWCTWNPRYDHDPVDMLLRGPQPPSDSIVIRANWQDNPFFPSGLRADLERDKRIDLANYLHVWEGDYQRIGEGAYYANELAQARSAGRIDEFDIDREAPIYTAWDLGIDDFTAIWVAQPVGLQVRLIDYHEDRGFDARHYADWVRDNRYDTGEAILPHDAGKRDVGSLLSYEEHLNKAGLDRTRVLERTLDLMGDIQRVRSFLAKCWFRESTTADGLKSLGAYRVEMDSKLRTPKPRPVHDWASHGADAFRQLAVGLVPQERLKYAGVRINVPGERERVRGYGGRKYRAALRAQ